jgi:hypothetical protein
MSNPFRYFNSSPEVIRPVVMMYLRYPLSLRNVEDLRAERSIDVSHETVRFWWNRFGPCRKPLGASLWRQKVDVVKGREPKDFGHVGQSVQRPEQILELSNGGDPEERSSDLLK